MSTAIDDMDKVTKIDLKEKSSAGCTGTELKELMHSYGRKKSSHEKQFSRYCLLLKQGAVALILASLMAALGSWAVLTVATALLAVWRLIQCFSIDEQCELLEVQTSQAKSRLEHALSAPTGKPMLAQLYPEFDDEPYQMHLAFYLPGPLEIRRRKTGFKLSRLLFP
ncbi:MAG: hypothetical protein V7739_10035 [Motiliproteus sp.]